MAINHYTQNYFGAIPSDRLITGFLTVNVRHSGAASAAQEDDWKASSREEPTNVDNTQGQADAQDQAIGDYHCFLFWVVAACHWHSHRSPTYASDYANGVPDHPHCQSFLRAHPVALINPDTGTLMNHKAVTVDSVEGVVVSKLGNPKNGASNPSSDSFASNWYWSDIASQFGIHNGLGSPYKQPTGTIVDDSPNLTPPSYAEYDSGSVIAGNPYSGFPDLAFNRRYNASNAYASGNNTGLMPNYGNGYYDSNVSVPASNNNPLDGDDVANDVSTDINNTLKSPVHSLLIEGWHDFAWTDTGSAFSIARHTAFNIRVQVKLNTDVTDAAGVAGPGAPSDNTLGARKVTTNVLFQPFGETNVVRFSTDLPTGTGPNP